MVMENSSEHKQIVILSFSFFPDNNPRSFRVFELVKELSRQGHTIALYIPENDFDYSEIMKTLNVQIIKIPYKNKKMHNNKHNPDFGKRISFRKFVGMMPGANRIKRMIMPLYFTLFPDGNFTTFALPLALALKQDKHKYDILISISTPFSVHVGTALALVANRNLARVKIAEYSDPFSSNPVLPRLIHYKLVEKYVTNLFDYIVVPHQNAVEAYLDFKDVNHIRVIPQGFKFEDVKKADYQKNTIPTFAYAGLFYYKIRNPSFLFDYLALLERDFRFIIYTNISSDDGRDLLNKYAAILKQKLIVKPMIPRLKCIYELSTADFLVNINNEATTQVPSKLIDYTLAGRPIVSLTRNMFNPEILNEFLDGNYAGSHKIDIDEYAIENVCRKFLELA